MAWLSISDLLHLSDWQKRRKIERLRTILLNRSHCLDPNANWMSRARWAAHLGEDSNLFDEVLYSLQRDSLAEFFETDLWRIGPQSNATKRRS